MTDYTLARFEEGLLRSATGPIDFPGAGNPLISTYRENNDLVEYYSAIDNYIDVDSLAASLVGGGSGSLSSTSSSSTYSVSGFTSTTAVASFVSIPTSNPFYEFSMSTSLSTPLEPSTLQFDAQKIMAASAATARNLTAYDFEL